MEPSARKMLEKQHYYIAGEHSGVKTCHWLKEKLLRRRVCYKESFYGIESHRCLQMTPALNFCNQGCIFCWRYHGFDKNGFGDCDDPETILDECIKGQRKLISGFKGDERTDPKMWEEATRPNQVAISLSGEPTFYPKLGEFIELCHKRGMTTFLVTNGTTPKVLENLDPLPSQLYVTVAAPNPKIFKDLCRPHISNGWELLNQTLDILPSLDTRTVIRHTLVKDWNFGWEREYAKLDEKADTDFIEPKGYVFVGESRKRMTITNMPSHQEVREFSERLGDILGRAVINEQKPSRVVLIGDEGMDTKLPGK